MAPCALNLRRRRCYANLRLPLWPRLRWVRLHWRRHPLLPGTAAAGIAGAGMAEAGTTAGAGAVPASLSAAPPISAVYVVPYQCRPALFHLWTPHGLRL